VNLGKSIGVLAASLAESTGYERDGLAQHDRAKHRAEVRMESKGSFEVRSGS